MSEVEWALGRQQDAVGTVGVGSMHALPKEDSYFSAGIWAKCCQVVWLFKRNQEYGFLYEIFRNLLQARQNICEPNSAHEL